MALFLVYGKNNTNSDPIKDARGCYKLGDIVEVHDDPPGGVDIVANPIAHPFYLVQITGVTKEQALKYMAPYIDPAIRTLRGGSCTGEGRTSPCR